MANKEETTKTTTTKRSNNWLLNFISFIAVICVGISLLLSKVGLNGTISNVLSLIAQVIAYTILVFISCRYIVRRRNIWLWIVWGVSVALIVAGLIIPLF